MTDTAKFTKLVESSAGPIIVTRNGYDAFVVMRSDKFESMQQEIAKAQLLERMAKANSEFEEKNYVDGKSFTAEIRAQHGI